MAEIFKFEKGVSPYILNKFSEFTEFPCYNFRIVETLKTEL